MQTINRWRVPRRLTGNVFVYGRPGAGKTCKLLTVAQGLHNHGFKIWDLFGGKRDEGGFWAFPSDDDKIWRQIEEETFDFKNTGAKQYKVKLLYPMFMSKIQKMKIPHNPPNVTAQVFTIPFRDIPDAFEQLIATVVGALGTQSSRLWDNVIEKTNRNSNWADVKHLFSKALLKKKNDKLYASFIKPLFKEGLLASEDSKLNLNFIEEAKDPETICVLCMDHIPQKFRYFIMGYFLRKLFALAKTNKIPKKNFALFREASLFMKVVDSDKNADETVSIFRNLITDIARYCRSGLFLGMDTQDSSEVRGMIEGSDDLLLICEMPSQKSREVTCDPLKKDRRMTETQIAFIGWKIKIHQVCVVERGQKARILKRINPPRCRYWKSEYGDFNSLWKREVNQYTDPSNWIDIYNQEVKLREETILVKTNELPKKPKEIKEEIKVEEIKEVEDVSSQYGF